jgi:hypothetical protein
MDSIIQKHAATSSILMTSDEINHYTGTTAINWEKPYFFFRSELDLPDVPTWQEYNQLKADHIRHMIPYKGKYFDYITHQEYDTLNDWAVDNGKTLNDIVYGVNFVHRTSNACKQRGFVTLETLIKHLDPNFELTNNYELIASIQRDLKAVINSLETIAMKIKKLQ